MNWTYDGDGKEGTYIEISEDGLNLLSSQKEFLKQYYSKILKDLEKIIIPAFIFVARTSMVMHEKQRR